MLESARTVKSQALPYGWQLHQSPHRHYKRQKDDGNWTWEGRDRKRIASVTDVLDSKDSLTPWAVARTLIAAERAAVQWLGAGPVLAKSLLDFPALTELTGLMPDSIRDDKGAIGNAVHSYAAGAILGDTPEIVPPYGYRVALDRFYEDTGVLPVYDKHGPRVERAVGCHKQAVAGTYDLQGHPTVPNKKLAAGTHRIDVKSSNTVQPKHFAQVASYEALARNVGEEPSDWLSIVHVTPLGLYEVYSIPARGPEADRALGLFHAYLTIHRSTPKLAKLLVKDPE